MNSENKEITNRTTNIQILRCQTLFALNFFHRVAIEGATSGILGPLVGRTCAINSLGALCSFPATLISPADQSPISGIVIQDTLVRPRLRSSCNDCINVMRDFRFRSWLRENAMKYGSPSPQKFFDQGFPWTQERKKKDIRGL